MNTNYFFPLLLSLLLLMSVNIAAQRPDVIELPAPQKTGGKPLFDAIAERQSNRDFSDKEIPLQELSTLLWSAYGVSRDDKRVIPTANNRQELAVYVFLKDAVYLYDGKEHKLLKKADGDHRRKAGQQEFVYAAPVNLLFVGPGTGEYIAAGCAVQDVYLACTSLGLSAVVRTSGLDAAILRPLLKFAEADVPICAQTLGYKTE